MKKIITVDNNMLNVDLVVFHDVLVLQNILFRLQSLKSTDGMTIIKVKKKDFLLLWDNNDVSKSLKQIPYVLLNRSADRGHNIKKISKLICFVIKSIPYMILSALFTFFSFYHIPRILLYHIPFKLNISTSKKIVVLSISQSSLFHSIVI